ncbi:MAG: ABC transporter permease [Candidatus Bipolaricaulia bacterium]
MQQMFGRSLVVILLLGGLIFLTVFTTQTTGSFYLATSQEIRLRIWEHIQLVIVAELLAIGIGVPLGFIITRRGFKRFSPLILGVANIGQTIPSLAVVAIMLPILGIGFKPAIVALFVYGLLPIVRNTYAGVNNIDPSVIESARGMGMTRGQILRKIELPLARAVMMAGIRTSTVINVGVATLAALIGSGGLGQLIIRGLNLNVTELMLQGAAPAAGLAILFDTALGGIESWMTPRGLKVG